MSWLNKIKTKKPGSQDEPREKPSDSAKASVDKAAPAPVKKKEEPKKAEEKKAAPLAKGSVKAARNLVRPIISEKAAHLAEAGKYMFEVSPEANKIEIKKSIKELYGVEAEGVNVMNVRGKQVRWGRHFGKRKNWKRAIVTVKKGQSIDLYEGV
jgi:large subunit ribosomal protein L23